MNPPTQPLLSVRDLAVRFPTEDGDVHAVDGVSFEISAGETLGIVGESGSGKSVTSLTILGLTRPEGAEISGEIYFDGTELTGLDDQGLQRIRGDEIAMIFQDPLSSLHPFFKIGNQLSEAIRVHRDTSDASARARAVELLELVGIPGAAGRLDSYPHELSGGMRQRVMIAMALCNDPRLLIADEPTTALDVTIQAQILRLLAQLRDELKMAMVMITHDLGVIAEVADDVLVMYGGRIVESAPLEKIFYDPQHPYTWGLLGSIPRIHEERGERLRQIKGQPPSLINPPEGCHFRPRCPHEFGKCPQVPPLESRSGESDHLDRCWLAADEKRARRTAPGDAIDAEREQ